MDQSESTDPTPKAAGSFDSSPDQPFGSATSSGTNDIKIEQLEDDKDDIVESDLTVNSPNQENPSPSQLYSKDKAPILGNCCGFSTLGCCKFWAILNCVLLLPSWILVCVVNFGDLMDQGHSDDVADKLAKYLEGGSTGARGAKLAIQILLLLAYTAASVLFLIANFPFSQVLDWRPLFTTLYIWSLISFAFVFVIPVPFRLAVGQCYTVVSLLAWMEVLSELAVVIVFLYFSWRVASLFQNYLDQTMGFKQTKQSTVSLIVTPPTPQPSKEDIAQ